MTKWHTIDLKDYDDGIDRKYLKNEVIVRVWKENEDE